MNLLPKFKEYLFSQSSPSSKTTVKNYLSDISRFIHWIEKKLGSFSPTLITPQLIEQFEKSDIRAASSRKRSLSSLRKFFTFLKLEGHVEHSPFEQNAANKKSTAEPDPYHLKGFKDYLYVYNASKLTIKNYLMDLRSFFRWFEEVTNSKNAWDIKEKDILGRIDNQIIEEYKRRLPYAPRTINRKLSSLRKYLKWAEDEGLIAQGVTVGQGVWQRGVFRPVVFEGKEARKINGEYSKFPPLRVAQKTFRGIVFIPEFILINPLASLARAFEHIAWRLQGKPVFELFKEKAAAKIKVKNLPKEAFAPFAISIKYLPLHRKLLFHIAHTRPKWYKRYHEYSFSHYLHLALLMVFMSAIGFGIYQNLYPKQTQGVLGFANPQVPPRILSFQGRLTDSSDNPITSSTNLRFALYDSPTGTGSALLWQEVNTITPDSDGIFSLLLGNRSTMSQSLFAERAGLWLGVTVGQTPELTPRQRLATVAYAENADNLQGLPPITQSGAGQTNVVLALDSSGNLTIGGSATPTFQATGGKFTISGNPLLLTTTPSSNSDVKNVQIAPGGWSFIDLQKPLQNTTNNNNLSSAVGAVEVDDTFAILATSSAQSAFTINQNDTGSLISASQNGTAKFTVDNSGNTTISGNFLSALTASRDLGSSSVRWNNLWVQTINATGTNTSGQASFTYDPADTTYAQATVLLNPTSAGPNELLLGAGIGGVERASIDTEGDLVLGFAGGTVTRNSNPLTVYNHGTTQVASIDTAGLLTLSSDLAVNGGDITSTGALTLTPGAGTNLNITLSTTGDLAVNTDDLYVDTSAGNVGIGTTGPIGLLNIQSADSGATTASANSDELVIEGSGNAGLSILTPNTALAQISFGDPQDNNVGSIAYNHSDNRMQFRTAGLNGGGIDIDSSGEVGIGTTTPGSLLEVDGGTSATTNLQLISTATSGIRLNVKMSDNSTATALNAVPGVNIQNTDTTVNNSSQLTFSSNDTAGTNITGALIGTRFTTHAVNDGATDLIFGTRPSSSAITEKMRITSGGKVGINTTDLSGNNQLRVVQSTSGTIAAGKFENGATSSVSLAIGNGYGMSILCEESNSIYCFQAGVGTSNITTMWGGGGWSIGNAATNQGAGTINVTGNIYKNGTAYNNPDYAFEKYFTGKIVKFAANEGASDYPGLLPLEEVEKYAKENYQLARVADKRGIFDRTDILLEKVEEIFLYLFEFNRRLVFLEKKLCVQSESSEDFGLIKNVCSQTTIEKTVDSGTYAVKTYLGEVVTGGQIIGEAVIGTVRAGIVETQELVAGKILSPVAEVQTVRTDTITPLSSDKVVIRLDTSASSASHSATPSFEIQNASGSAVASITDKGDALFSGRLSSQGLNTEEATVSGTLRTKNLVAENIDTAILNLKSSILNLSEQSASSSAIDIASYSGQLTNVDTLNAQVGTFMQGLFAVGPTSLSDATVFGQLSVGGSLILADNSINVLGSDFEIQPLGQGGVSFLAGKVIIDSSGNLNVNGDARFNGTLFANVLSPIPGNDLVLKLLNKNASESAKFKIVNASGSAVASIDSEGNALFNKLNLNIISPALALSETEFVATGSAGIATVSAHLKEVTVLNKLVTDKSLIYITPVGTSSAVPFLLRQDPSKSFTVGVQNESINPTTFNWLIIN